jgi:curved DNA-binding protein CbpA
VLGVAQDAPEAVVKEAAREKLKITHPDHGGSGSEFQRVKQARDRLLE